MSIKIRKKINMNVLKPILIVAGLFFSHLVLAQAKDESFSASTDPVKLVQVYPNPATEFLTITFESPIARKSKFTIHNIIGNEVEIEPEMIDEFEVKIRVKEFHEGYYFLSIQNGQTAFKSTIKFLKR
jgi:hypothetical protein